MKTTAVLESGLPALAQQLPLATYACGLDGHILWYNQAAARLWGRKPKEDDRYSGSFRTLLPDGSELGLEKGWMARAIKERREVEQEILFEAPDCSRRFIVASARPIYDSVGELAGAVSSLVDRTREWEATETERFLSAVVNQTDEAIITLSPDGQVRTWNRGAERIFGFSAEEMIGETLAAVTPPDRREEGKRLMGKMLGGEVVRAQVVRNRKDGTQIDVALTASPVLDEHGQVLGVSSLARDITELETNRRRYEMLAETSPCMVFHCDRWGRANYVNNSLWTELTGREAGSWAGEGWAEAIHPEDRERVLTRWRAAVAARSPFWEDEHRLLHLDGTETWVLAKAKPMFDDRGAVESYTGACTVISERKEAEQALRRANDELEGRVMERTSELSAMVEDLTGASEELQEVELALENSMTGISRLDAEGTYQEVREGYAAMLGYRPEEMLGMSWERSVAEEERPVAAAAYEEMVAEGRAEAEIAAVRKDGTRFFKHILLVRREDAAGAFAGHYCFMRDVSERRLAEAELHLRNRALEASGCAVVITDSSSPDNLIVDCNPAFSRITGYDREEVLGRNCRLLQGADRAQPEFDLVRAAVKAGKECRVTLRNYRKNGEMFWNDLVLSPVKDANGVLTNFVGVQNDVTEQRRTATALRQELARTDQILTTSMDGYVLAEFQGTIRDVNPAYCENVGYSREELLGKNIRELECPRTDEEVAQRIEVLKDQGRLSFETKHRHRDGRAVDLEVSLSVLSNGDDPLVVGILRNITDRKRAEQRLARRSEFERLLLRLSTEFIANDPGMLESAISDALEAAGEFAEADRSYIFTFSPDRSTASNTHEWCAEGIEPLIDRFQALPLTASPWLMAKLLNGEGVHFSDRAPLPPEAAVDRDFYKRFSISSFLALPLRFAGEVVGFIGFDASCSCRCSEEPIQALLQIIGDIYINAQRRHEAEESLRASEGKWRSLVNNAPSYITLIDRQGRIKFINRVGAGYTREQVLGANVLDFMGEGKHEFVGRLMEQLFESQESVQYEHQDLTGAWYSCNSVPIVHDGEVTEAISISTDITAMVQSQRDLHDKTVLLDEAQRLAKLGNWEWDLRTKRLQWSDELCRIYGVDPEGFEPTFEGFLARLHPDDRPQLQSAIDGLLASGGSFELEERIIRHRDGEQRTLHCFGYAVSDEGGRVIKLRGACQDVTQQKHAEIRLRESLREKETLLREIHHRVKNNLQIVSSLLHFQVRKLTDPAAMTIIREGQERLRAMIMVHEQLYGSSDLSRINFSEYLVRLANELQRSRNGNGESAIALRVVTDEVSLPIEIALPAGMIVSELVTNAFKHAFSNRSGGTIEIQLAKSSTTLTLRVADDGRGLPEVVETENPQSFGMQLIRSLTRQIGAEFAFERDEGTCAILELQIEEEGGLHGNRQ